MRRLAVILALASWALLVAGGLLELASNLGDALAFLGIMLLLPAAGAAIAVMGEDL